MFFTTKKEGAQLRTEMKQLREDFSAQREALDAQLAKASVEVEKLEKVLEEATKLLARNNADVGAQVERLQAAVDSFSGKLEESQHALDLLRKELAEHRAQVDAKLAEVSQPSSGLPESKDALYADAERRFAEKHYKEVRRILKQFIEQHGDDSRADNARFLVGEAYFAEGRYAAAIGEYQQVIDHYPKGDVVDDAFLRNGVALYRLKSCSDARVFLQEMLRRFPKSPLAPRARQTLDEIEKYRKKKSKCSS